MAGKSLSPLGGSEREEVNALLVFSHLQSAVVLLGARKGPFCSQASCTEVLYRIQLQD